MLLKRNVAMTKIYTVTFCALDESFEGNVFWHSCLLLSEAEDGSKMKVVDNWGFYGLPTTTRDTYIGKFKIMLGLDVDFEGNHGMLRHEDLRYLETGYGLHGVTFELTKEKFDELQAKCKKMEAEQNDAINEAVAKLGVEEQRADKSRIYPFEKFSRRIFEVERNKALQEGSQSRLKAFEVKPTWTYSGPALNQSRTCKSQTVELLSGILTPAQIDRITEKGVHPTVPRYSGVLENMYLHSSGPLREHTKKSGEKVYYRDANDPGVELHWTLPPQEIEVLSTDTANRFKISKSCCNKVKSKIGMLQKLEWLFINARLPEQYEAYRQDLLAKIRDRFEGFAKIEPKPEMVDSSVNRSYFASFFSPKNPNNEMALLQKIALAEMLINNIYAAAVDGWRIDPDVLSEADQHPLNKDEVLDFNPLEAVASYLSVEDKKKLCAIINRTYVEPLATPTQKLAYCL